MPINNLSDKGLAVLKWVLDENRFYPQKDKNNYDVLSDQIRINKEHISQSRFDALRALFPHHADNNNVIITASELEPLFKTKKLILSADINSITDLFNKKAASILLEEKNFIKPVTVNFSHQQSSIQISPAHAMETRWALSKLASFLELKKQQLDFYNGGSNSNSLILFDTSNWTDFKDYLPETITRAVEKKSLEYLEKFIKQPTGSQSKTTVKAQTEAELQVFIRAARLWDLKLSTIIPVGNSFSLTVDDKTAKKIQAFSVESKKIIENTSSDMQTTAFNFQPIETTFPTPAAEPVNILQIDRGEPEPPAAGYNLKQKEKSLPLLDIGTSQVTFTLPETVTETKVSENSSDTHAAVNLIEEQTKQRIINLHQWAAMESEKRQVQPGGSSNPTVFNVRLAMAGEFKYNAERNTATTRDINVTVCAAMLQVMQVKDVVEIQATGKKLTVEHMTTAFQTALLQGVLPYVNSECKFEQATILAKLDPTILEKYNMLRASESFTALPSWQQDNVLTAEKRVIETLPLAPEVDITTNKKQSP